MTLTSLEANPRLAVAIDGADEADSDLTLIKGGGGCLAQEKVVAANADLFVVIADDRKRSEQLGNSWKYVPIEVLELAYKPLTATIEVRMSYELSYGISATLLTEFQKNYLQFSLI